MGCRIWFAPVGLRLIRRVFAARENNRINEMYLA
jgi:hypothetical protein